MTLGPSPVIGIIIMVGIVLIIAIVFGNFIFTLGSIVEKDATFGLMLDEEDGNVSMVMTKLVNADYVIVRGAEGTRIYGSEAVENGTEVEGNVLLNEEKERIKLTGISENQRIEIIGVIGNTPTKYVDYKHGSVDVGEIPISATTTLKKEIR